MLTFFFFLLILFILTQSEISLYYAFHGLTLWYGKMVPSLLPFMIVIGVCVRQNIAGKIAGFFSPVLFPVFHCRREVLYCILVGFLCGFPMGARVTAQMYQAKIINRTEARFLLSFCNNIGPVYCLSFVAPLLKIQGLPLFLGIQYGIPLLYGIVLRYTIFQRELSPSQHSLPSAAVSDESIWQSLDISIQQSIQGITMLCGYMIFFNLLNLLPHSLCPDLLHYIAPVLEITGGLELLGTQNRLFSLCVLSFGGISCLAQTYSTIQQGGLPFGEYILHRLMVTLLSIPCYLLLLRFLF